MPGTFLKLICACLLLLGAFLKAQAKPKQGQKGLSPNDDSPKYNPSPKKLDSDLAWMAKQMEALHAEAAKQAISPESLVAFLSNDVATRIEREKNPKDKSLFTRSHERMWEEFLKWLGAYPKLGLLEDAQPVVSVNELLIANGVVNSAALAKVHPEIQKDGSVKQALDAFYADYRREVLKNRKWPSSGNVGCCGFGSGDPHKEKLFKVSQMGVFIGLASWTVNLFKTAKLEAEHLALVRAAMAELHKQRTAEGIGLAPFVALLDSYLDLHEPERARKLWADPLSRSHVWLPYLTKLEILSTETDIPAKKVNSFFVVRKIWDQVRSEILDKTDTKPVGPFDGTYHIAELFDSFYRGYEKVAVTLKVPTRHKIIRMAEFITLGRWAIETWKREKEEAEKKKAQAQATAQAQAAKQALSAGIAKDPAKGKKKPGKAKKPVKNGSVPGKWRQFPIKKALWTFGGLVGTGLAAKYGVPPLWEAIMGTEAPGSAKVDEAASPASKPDLEEESEDFKDEEEEGGSKVWLFYLLGGVAAVVIINFVLVAGCYLYWSTGRPASEEASYRENPSSSQNDGQDYSKPPSVSSVEGAYSLSSHVYSEPVELQSGEKPESNENYSA